MHIPGRRADLRSVMRFGRITEATLGVHAGSRVCRMQPKCIRAKGSAPAPQMCIRVSGRGKRRKNVADHLLTSSSSEVSFGRSTDIGQSTESTKRPRQMTRPTTAIARDTR